MNTQNGHPNVNAPNAKTLADKITAIWADKIELDAEDQALVAILALELSRMVIDAARTA